MVDGVAGQLLISEAEQVGGLLPGQPAVTKSCRCAFDQCAATNHVSFAGGGSCGRVL